MNSATYGFFNVDNQPRERLLLHGCDRVSTTELLAILLGSGIRGCSALTMAEYVIHAIGGLPILARAAARELVGLPGIGAARATRIAAAFHLGRRALESGYLQRSVIQSPRDLYERLVHRLCGLVQEVFWIVALDARYAILDELEVARGGLTSVEVHPREVFRPLIRRSAAAAVVAHNHPGGSCEPSKQDITLTYRLQRAGEIIGIPILDHIVVGAAGCRSVYEHLNLQPNLTTPC
ncbi:MAG: DNA repair protein RadC [Haliangiales bacterium]